MPVFPTAQEIMERFLRYQRRAKPRQSPWSKEAHRRIKRHYLRENLPWSYRAAAHQALNEFDRRGFIRSSATATTVVAIINGVGLLRVRQNTVDTMIFDNCYHSAIEMFGLRKAEELTTFLNFLFRQADLNDRASY